MKSRFFIHKLGESILKIIVKETAIIRKNIDQKQENEKRIKH